MAKASPYVVPLVTWIVLGSLINLDLARAFFPYLYGVNVLAVGGVLFFYRRIYKQFSWRPNALAIGMGVLALVGWVVIEKFLPYPHLGSRHAYNPYTEISADGLRNFFLLFRFIGLVVIVPVIEELFWRGWAYRTLINSDFEKVSWKSYDHLSWWGTAAGFALSHPEWLSAFLFGLLMNALLKRTGNLIACIQTHAVTNLLLGIYVLCTGSWSLW